MHKDKLRHQPHLALARSHRHFHPRPSQSIKKAQQQKQCQEHIIQAEHADHQCSSGRSQLFCTGTRATHNSPCNLCTGIFTSHPTHCTPIPAPPHWWNENPSNKSDPRHMKTQTVSVFGSRSGSAHHTHTHKPSPQRSAQGAHHPALDPHPEPPLGVTPLGVTPCSQPRTPCPRWGRD